MGPADALEIEVQAEQRLADASDAARERGRGKVRGRHADRSSRGMPQRPRFCAASNHRGPRGFCRDDRETMEMTMFAAPLMAVVLFAIGGLLGVVSERYGVRATNALLYVFAICAVSGLVVAMARSPGVAMGSFAQLTPRTAVQ